MDRGQRKGFTIVGERTRRIEKREKKIGKRLNTHSMLCEKTNKQVKRVGIVLSRNCVLRNVGRMQYGK